MYALNTSILCTHIFENPSIMGFIFEQLIFSPGLDVSNCKRSRGTHGLARCPPRRAGTLCLPRVPRSTQFLQRLLLCKLFACGTSQWVIVCACSHVLPSPEQPATPTRTIAATPIQALPQSQSTPKRIDTPSLEEPSDLEELEQFAKTFKQRRIKLGFTQVGRGRFPGFGVAQFQIGTCSQPFSAFIDLDCSSYSQYKCMI